MPLPGELLSSPALEGAASMKPGQSLTPGLSQSSSEDEMTSRSLVGADVRARRDRLRLSRARSTTYASQWDHFSAALAGHVFSASTSVHPRDIRMVVILRPLQGPSRRRLLS